MENRVARQESIPKQVARFQRSQREAESHGRMRLLETETSRPAERRCPRRFRILRAQRQFEITRARFAAAGSS